MPFSEGLKNCRFFSNSIALCTFLSAEGKQYGGDAFCTRRPRRFFISCSRRRGQTCRRARPSDRRPRQTRRRAALRRPCSQAAQYPFRRQTALLHPIGGRRFVRPVGRRRGAFQPAPFALGQILVRRLRLIVVLAEEPIAFDLHPAHHEQVEQQEQHAGERKQRARGQPPACDR